MAAALGALGSLDGKRVAHRRRRPDHRGGRRVGRPPTAAPPQPQAGFDVECDALLVAGKAGVLEHDLAATVRAKVVVPLTPVPVTARALAVLGRAGVVVVPDFLSTAAPLLAAVDPDGGDAMTRVHESVAALAGEGTNLWMAAVDQGGGPPPHLAGRAPLRPPALLARQVPARRAITGAKGSSWSADRPR